MSIPSSSWQQYPHHRHRLQQKDGCWWDDAEAVKTASCRYGGGGAAHWELFSTEFVENTARHVTSRLSSHRLFTIVALRTSLISTILLLSSRLPLAPPPSFQTRWPGHRLVTKPPNQASFAQRTLDNYRSPAPSHSTPHDPPPNCTGIHPHYNVCTCFSWLEFHRPAMLGSEIQA